MKKGMTLIELLIVIALIAVLAAINFAVLNKVRQRAYLGTCINNLRQLVLAVHMYENDWGTVPIENPVETPEGIYGFVQQMLNPYVRDDSIFLCPADFTGGRYSYAEDALGNPMPMNPKVIRWKGREWLTSYQYFVNIGVVELFGGGSTRLLPESPLFTCDWHHPHFRNIETILARYNGAVEVVPLGLYKRLHALFEGGKRID
ncbi:type II secretion system protein [Fervidibacter sacchari]|uniref:Prepilin-type N-terminal cleavage/methylation domain-containing protein n=1 Tax=Candidatus Fervidibacter sacchari TaxID=1448929 RepID=A0ABT2ENY4_9BACT|nr:type II secretion system protein [Candidatus Fervidibacter sacchari]MCS3919404.1 prepilin-type N-terminal cleavage/methylation domain-containing protein [Candidatus Fervidibacter sacchari]WKU15138.1 type II secretion system protein [Candidatus Fervidibacter sacchari]